jgi:4-hydroxybenzoyl-CoA thioesterase
MGDAEHFSMRSVDTESLDGAGFGADAPVFRTEEDIVGDWMADRQGRMPLSRYFECLNIAIEEWLEFTLGIPFREMHIDCGIGIPTVRFDTQVRERPALGESFSIGIRPLRLGNRAMTFRSLLVTRDGCQAQSDQVVVFVRMQPDGYESIDIPDDMRAGFGKQMTED